MVDIGVFAIRYTLSKFDEPRYTVAETEIKPVIKTSILKVNIWNKQIGDNMANNVYSIQLKTHKI